MKAEERKREKYLPTLLVQQIRLQWYKDCRGGNAAAQRNQYPRAMRLPKDFFSYYSFGLPTHFVSILQRPDGFQIDKDCRRLMEWKPNGTMRLHPFELIQQESGIQVHYRYDWHIGAMPERYTYDKTGQKQPLNELALDLIPGDYGRAVCNGRFRVPFPVSWTVKMKKKQKETQDILSYHTQAAGCSDKARAKASGGRQPIEECGRTGL